MIAALCHSSQAWKAALSFSRLPTESRPFPGPESGTIAIKVINHYGDEVLKVVSV